MKEKIVDSQTFKIICREMKPTVTRDFEGLKPLLQLNTVEGSKLSLVSLNTEKLINALAENKTVEQTYYFHSNKWPLKNLHVETYPEIKATITPGNLPPHSTAIIHLKFDPAEIMEKYGHIDFPFTVEYETPYTFLLEPSNLDMTRAKEKGISEDTELVFKKRMWRKRGFILLPQRLVERDSEGHSYYKGCKVEQSVTEGEKHIAIKLQEVKKHE